MSRPLRADAQANHERLLEVAADAFARDGAEASLKAIAADAGVGIGTLYRRFPTRESLIEAVYRSETRWLCDSATDLLNHRPPLDALQSWMESFVDYMLTKQGMADALPVILAAHEGLSAQSRESLVGAVGRLLGRGIDDGVIGEGVDKTDVLMALGGITLITGHEHERGLASRLITLLLDGIVIRESRT
jgi:AcrR family transcriptional regulator